MVATEHENPEIRALVAELIDIDGESFDPKLQHFELPESRQIADVASLRDLRRFAKLTSASFAGTNLDDQGLAHVCDVATLESLDLQETCISDAGLQSLTKLSRLKNLRLADNLQLTNACVQHLSRLRALSDLQIQETSISEAGLVQLRQLPHLRDVCLAVWEGNYSFGGLLTLSKQMPRCTFVAKGSGEFRAGHFDGTWG